MLFTPLKQDVTETFTFLTFHRLTFVDILNLEIWLQWILKDKILLQ